MKNIKFISLFCFSFFFSFLSKTKIENFEESIEKVSKIVVKQEDLNEKDLDDLQKIGIDNTNYFELITKNQAKSLLKEIAEFLKDENKISNKKALLIKLVDSEISGILMKKLIFKISIFYVFAIAVGIYLEKKAKKNEIIY